LKPAFLREEMPKVKENQMSTTTRHVLKAAEVTLEEPLRLSLDPTAAAACAGPRSAPDAASVRITQSHPDHAVIEVTCSCGRTTYLRCDYAAASPPPVRQESSRE
jgi:hypothetical protein